MITKPRLFTLSLLAFYPRSGFYLHLLTGFLELLDLGPHSLDSTTFSNWTALTCTQLLLLLLLRGHSPFLLAVGLAGEVVEMKSSVFENEKHTRRCPPTGVYVPILLKKPSLKA
ncbi:hypothetical protein EV1_027254 [Malus domestica]